MATATPSWQHDILLRLQARDAQDGAYIDIIENCKRLAAQTVILKERNRSLLRAASTSRQNGQQGSSSNSDNPVQQAYVATLESQITTLREENAGLYKIQAQNSQRLVHLNEQLRSSEDTHRQEHTELVHLRSERNAREREREEAVQLRKEKDRNIETLQDELSMMKLEFEMLEKTNEALKEDNSSLLRRWLEKKAQEAAEMDKMVTEATGKLNISDGNK